jgi:hypothetical protein
LDTVETDTPAAAAMLVRLPARPDLAAPAAMDAPSGKTFRKITTLTIAIDTHRSAL